METRPAHFIDEPITAHYREPQTYAKTPACPDGFTWRGQEYTITRLLAEWRDYTRRGRMARNMMPQHAAVASNRGSWGVGRFFFRIQVDTGQIFEIYYDRAPNGADDRKGHWVLYGEREAI